MAKGDHWKARALSGKPLQAALNIVQRALAAYGSQRDQIGDSDLDDEQPLSLHVSLTLGQIRHARYFVMAHDMNPADFPVRAEQRRDIATAPVTSPALRSDTDEAQV